MWTDTTRVQYARADLDLPNDLTDGEWALLEPFFPPPPRMWGVHASGRSGGLLRRFCIYCAGACHGGCCRPCFPPVSTVRRWFYLWRDNGLWLSLNYALLLIGREAAGREVSPALG